MTKAGRLILDLILAISLGLFLVIAIPYNSQARLVPLVVGIPSFIFILIQIVLDLRQKETVLPVEGGVEEAQVKGVARREAFMVIWIAGLVLALYLLGFLIALPLYVFVYLKLREGRGWALSLGMGAAFLLTVYVFTNFLLVDLYRGLIPLKLAGY